MPQDGAITMQLRPLTLVSMFAAAVMLGWISAALGDVTKNVGALGKEDNADEPANARTMEKNAYQHNSSVIKDCDDDGNKNRSTINSQENNGNSTTPLPSKEHVRKFGTVQEAMDRQHGSLSVRPIGTVRSIYQLCVGTPRQGLLAPDSRGRIELAMDSSAAIDATVGLQDYSHVWIVFLFHLNTVSIQEGLPSNPNRVPLKIAPPALGGTKKVGVLATRSPHRLNPIGITLARLEDITIIHKQVSGRKKPLKTISLSLSGLDLVDGTPVLDVKPYVPIYDAPLADDTVRLPEWVTSGLATRRKVDFSDEAVQELTALLEEQPHCLEFYKADSQSDTDTVVQKVLACMKQVLSMDVRSRYQTRKARRGASHAERAQRMQECYGNKSSGNGGEEDETTTAPSEIHVASSSNHSCTQQIDNLLVSYRVLNSSGNGEVKQASSVGSGAEDSVVVDRITLRS